MDGQKIWNNILTGIKSQVSSSTFKTWFAGSFVLGFQQKADKKLLIIAFKNNFIKEQVEARYLPLISQIAKKNKEGDIEIVPVVASKENGAKTIKNEPIFSGVPMQMNLNSKTAHVLNSNFTFDNFVVGPSNNLAFLAAKQVAAGPGSSYNPLLIYGPTGVGKTHLLQAIGNEVLNKTVEAKVLYATAEKFTNDYIESLGNKTCSTFRAKYRKVDLLIIDDVQFFAGKESTQDEFFHTFNELYLSTRQVICASDRHPKELGKLKERLLSRFLGGLVADINIPDLEMKIAIIRAKCQEKNLNLDEEITAYIAQTSDGGAREIEGNLISVLTQMKLTGGQITIEQVKEAIHKNGQPFASKPTASAIFSAVCRYFGVPAEDLRGPARRASLAFARQVLMYLLRKQLNLPFDEIGRLTGHRDHSTVIYGVTKIENTIRGNQAKKDEVLRIQQLANVAS